VSRILKRPLPRDSAAQTRDADGWPEAIGPDSQPLGQAPDLLRSSNGASGGSRSASPAARTDLDGVLTQLVEEAAGDLHSVGLLLGGSRAFGSAGSDSTYDLVWIIDDQAARLRGARGTLRERRVRSDSTTIEITYLSLEKLRWLASHGQLSAAAFASSRVIVDKTGELALLSTAIATRLGVLARERVAAEYDSYLDGFAHSLKSWSRGDDLGTRAHAAQSGLHLIRAIFGLEQRVAPYPDQWSARLVEVEEPQGWPPGFLLRALVRLLYAPDPPFQQMLERRVGRVMESRGIRHKWRHDIQRLRAMQYDEL
jgi:hypothetical protein